MLEIGTSSETDLVTTISSGTVVVGNETFVKFNGCESFREFEPKGVSGTISLSDDS